MPSGPITKVRTKTLKEVLNELVQNIWIEMDLKELGVLNEYEGQFLI